MAEGDAPAYPEQLRRDDGTHRVRTFAGALMIIIGFYAVAPVVTWPILALAVRVQLLLDGAHGADFASTLHRAQNLQTITPASLLWLNCMLALGTPMAIGLARSLHGASTASLWSVRPGIRWAFLRDCVLLGVVVIFLASRVASILPGESAASGQASAHAAPGEALGLLAVIVLTTPLQALGEEFCFRGYLLQALGSTFTTPLAVVATSMLFALAHGTQNAPLFIDRLAFGLSAAYVAWKVGGIEAGVAVHTVNNLFALVASVLVGSISTTLQVSHASWWHLVVTVVQDGLFVVGALWLARRHGLIGLAARARTSIGNDEA